MCLFNRQSFLSTKMFSDTPKEDEDDRYKPLPAGNMVHKYEMPPYF